MRTGTRRWLPVVVVTALAAFSTAGAAQAFGVTAGKKPRPGTSPASGVIARIPSAASPDMETGGFGSVWAVAVANSTVIERINPRTNHVTARIGLGLGSASGDFAIPSPLSAGSGAVWVSDYWRSRVERINPATNKIVAHIPVGLSPSGLVASFGYVYVANANAGTLSRINPRTNRVDRVVRIGGPGKNGFGAAFPQPAAFYGSIWVPVQSLHQVVRINPRTMRVTLRLSVRPAADCGFLLPTAQGFWIDDSPCSNEMARYDISSRRIVASIHPSNCLTGGVMVHGFLYDAQSHFDASTGNCGPGFVVKRNAASGAQVASMPIGPGTFVVGISFVAGSLWTNDVGHNLIVRLGRF